MCMWKPINVLVVFSYQFGVAIKPGHDCMYHSSDVFMCALEFRWLYNFLGKVSHQMDMFTGLSLKLFPCCIINDVNSSLSTYNLHIGVIWLKVNMAGWQTIDMQSKTFRYVRMCVCDLGNGRNQQNLKHISGVISQPISIYFYATIQAKWAAGLYYTARMYAYMGTGDAFLWNRISFGENPFLDAKSGFFSKQRTKRNLHRMQPFLAFQFAFKHVRNQYMLLEFQLKLSCYTLIPLFVENELWYDNNEVCCVFFGASEFRFAFSCVEKQYFCPWLNFFLPLSSNCRWLIKRKLDIKKCIVYVELAVSFSLQSIIFILLNLSCCARSEIAYMITKTKAKNF